MDRRKKLKCANCGKIFSDTVIRGRIKKHCSDFCRREYDTKIRSSGVSKRAKYVKQCKKCFICFETIYKTSKYCSVECAQKKNKLDRKKCVICNKIFDPTGRTQKCCSAKCAKIKGSKTQTTVNWKENRKKFERLRAKTDPGFKLNRNMRRSVYQSLKGNKKHNSWESLVGYSVMQLKRHIEKQFAPGMSWGNWGEWHIDHIIPVSAFNFKSYNDQDFKECWSLKNLRPLWATDNLRKSNKLESHYQMNLFQ